MGRGNATGGVKRACNRNRKTVKAIAIYPKTQIRPLINSELDRRLRCKTDDVAVNKLYKAQASKCIRGTEVLDNRLKENAAKAIKKIQQERREMTTSLLLKRVDG